jgi:hypothetical protein
MVLQRASYDNYMPYDRKTKTKDKIIDNFMHPASLENAVERSLGRKVYYTFDWCKNNSWGSLWLSLMLS